MQTPKQCLNCAPPLGTNSKQYPMASEVRKENLLLLSNVIAMRLWLFQTATGFACKTLPARLGQTTRKMTYDFSADKQTKIDILEFIFNETDLCVYDLASTYGQEICEYKSVDSVTKKFDLVHGDKFALTFQLWSPRFKGDILFRKVTLDPKHCNGHTFRYSTDGWGLIQLYFGGIKNGKQNESHIGHFTEKAALEREATTTFNGKVSNWDWTEIQKTSRTLKQKIQNVLTAKQN